MPKSRLGGGALCARGAGAPRRGRERVRPRCLCAGGGFGSSAPVCVCYGRGDAEGEETLLVLHANDRFGCNKSLDVGLGKMI